MIDEWYDCYNFIKEAMTFYSYEDFYNQKYILKRNYELMSVKEKQLYKLYVYSRRNILLSLVNEIWDYLNGYLKVEYMTTPYMIEKRKNARNKNKHRT